jgi:hypothetical protein
MADFTQSLSDSVSESDISGKSVAKPLSSSISESDALTKRVAKPVSSSISESDALTKRSGKRLSDTAHPTDSEAKRASNPQPIYPKTALPDSVSDIEVTIKQCLFAMNENDIFVPVADLVPTKDQTPISFLIQLLQAMVNALNGLGITVDVPTMGAQIKKIGDSYATQVSSSYPTGDGQIVFARILADTVFQRLRDYGYLE